MKKLGLKISPKNLIISESATIIFSFHRNIDKIRENRKGPNKIGTTGRGIGPAYEDKVGRRAIRLGDLKNQKSLEEKVKNILDYHNIILSGLKSKLLSFDETMDEINSFKNRILKYIQRTSPILNKAKADRKKFFLKVHKVFYLMLIMEHIHL